MFHNATLWAKWLKVVFIRQTILPMFDQESETLNAGHCALTFLIHSTKLIKGSIKSSVNSFLITIYFFFLKFDFSFQVPEIKIVCSLLKLLYYVNFPITKVFLKKMKLNKKRN